MQINPDYIPIKPDETISSGTSLRSYTIPITTAGQYAIQFVGYGFIVEECDDPQATIAINNPLDSGFNLAKVGKYIQPIPFENLYITIRTPSATGKVKLILFGNHDTLADGNFEYIRRLLFGAFTLPRFANASVLWSVNAASSSNTIYVHPAQAYFPLYPTISSVTPVSIVSGTAYNLSVDAYTNPTSTTLQNNFIASTYLPVNQAFVQSGFQVTYQPTTTGTGNNIFLIQLSIPLSVYQYENLLGW